LEDSNALNPEDFLSSLIHNAPLGIISVNESGLVTHANHLANELLQISPQNSELAGQDIFDSVQHIPSLQDRLYNLKEKKGRSFITETIHINKRYIIIKGVRFQNGFICIISEVTRLIEMETESIQTMMAGQENERRRIAREIHDGIGPLLSYTKLELDAFYDEFVDHNNGIAEEKLMNIRQTLDSVTQDLRNLSHHLIPRLLEEFGLFSAFSNLVTRLNNSIKSKVEFYSNIGTEIRFDRDLELNLYRCGQELLQNAVKHAKASEILVQLIKHDHSIVLMVEDDGIGFEKAENKMEIFGIGLTNIETRVRTLNGDFFIESSENKGTTASIELSLK
jgi:signal transduction histidine kinase